MLDLSDFFEEFSSETENNINTKGIVDPIHEVRSVSAGLDNGSNDDAAIYWNPCKRHKTVAEAFNNVRSLSIKAEPYPSYKTYNHVIILDGHGSPGGFDCGSGMLGYGDYNRISLTNREYWLSEIYNIDRDVGYIGKLLLYSCDTGAEEAGAKLVWEISTRFGTMGFHSPTLVAARTGTMWYQKVPVFRPGGHGVKMVMKQFFEKGSTWQTCSGRPLEPPMAIPSPKHELVEKFKLDTLEDISKELDFNFYAIETIDLVRYGNVNFKESIYKKDDITKIISKMFSSPIFRTDGHPSAMRTMRLTLNPSHGLSLNVEILMTE